MVTPEVTAGNLIVLVSVAFGMWWIEQHLCKRINSVDRKLHRILKYLGVDDAVMLRRVK